MINKDEYSWLILLCARINKKQKLNYDGPSQRHIIKKKKGKRKVQGVPQSQTAALPRPQEEEETDKRKQAQTEQTHQKHQDQPPSPQARQSQHQKDWKTQEQNDTWKDTQQIAPQNKPQSNKEQDQHRDHRLRTVGRANHRGV